MFNILKQKKDEQSESMTLVIGVKVKTLFKTL